MRVGRCQGLVASPEQGQRRELVRVLEGRVAQWRQRGLRAPAARAAVSTARSCGDTRTERDVPAVLAGREGAQRAVAGPQHRLPREETEVDQLALHAVLQVADADEIRVAGADREHAAGAPLEQPFAVRDDVHLEQAQVAVEPAWDPRPPRPAAQLDRVRAIERLDHGGEGPLDLLAAIRALRRQLALRLEVALEQSEAHDTLVRRDLLVHDGHDLAEVGLDRLRRRARERAVVEVGHDQQRVVVAAVPDQEGPLDARHVRQPALDGCGRDGLAARVLVDVLHAVDDLEVPARPLHEDVAGRQPVLARVALARRLHRAPRGSCAM